MNNETKAILEILIREIQDLRPNKDIEELLESWINANDLHPERVKTRTGFYYREDADPSLFPTKAAYRKYLGLEETD